PGPWGGPARSSCAGCRGSAAAAHSTTQPGTPGGWAGHQEGVPSAGAGAGPSAGAGSAAGAGVGAEPSAEPVAPPAEPDPAPQAAEPEPQPALDPVPTPAEAASDSEPGAAWAVPAEQWGQTGDPAARDYPMEPTPPRGHPSPGNGGALPTLPKRVPKSARTDAQDGVRDGVDAPAPAPRTAPTAQVEEPEVPAVERTMELTLHRLSREGQEDHDDREGREGGDDGDDGEDFDRRFRAPGHGIRPVGADAWGPAVGGPTAQGTPAAPGEPSRVDPSRVDPYAIGPDQHARPRDEAARTDKGLPKRTPRNLALREPDSRERTGSVNAEELRRRLGGFQRGARDGRRDAAAEVAARGEPARRQRGTAGQTGAQSEGGTVEEARG
ncbi:ATP-binding protein, partial [Streptomyces sp. NPDC127074]